MSDEPTPIPDREAPADQTVVDPEASPFALHPVEGIPFARDSEEAQAIRAALAEAAEARRTGASRNRT